MNQHQSPQPTGDVHMERTDACNWSTLKALLTSPKHYLWNLSHPRADTDALRLGRVLHCLVLEPDEFNGRYIVEPRFNRACNDDTAVSKGYDGGKQAAAAWLASVGDREPVDADTYKAAYAMCNALKSDPVAAPHIASGVSEHRIDWVDEQTGIACRGRVDKVNGCLSDLKSTRSIVTFERDVARFGYFSQLAWYADGLAAAGIVTDGAPCLIAVESEPPYDVQVLTFDPDDLAAGRKVYRRCLEHLAWCRREGRWLGVSGGKARRIVLPPWTDPIVDEPLVIDGVEVSV